MSGFLLDLTDWLFDTHLVEFSLWLAETKVSALLRNHFLIIPTLQVAHILAIAAAFGAVQMINARVMGMASTVSTVEGTMRRFTPWIWGGLAALIVTGGGLILADPPRELLNALFWVKMALMAGLILLSLWFQRAIRRNMVSQDIWAAQKGEKALICAGAIALSFLWCAIMVAGRLIYYGLF